MEIVESINPKNPIVIGYENLVFWSLLGTSITVPNGVCVWVGMDVAGDVGTFVCGGVFVEVEFSNIWTATAVWVKLMGILTCK